MGCSGSGPVSDLPLPAGDGEQKFVFKGSPVYTPDGKARWMNVIWSAEGDLAWELKALKAPKQLLAKATMTENVVFKKKLVGQPFEGGATILTVRDLMRAVGHPGEEDGHPAERDWGFGDEDPADHVPTASEMGHGTKYIWSCTREAKILTAEGKAFATLKLGAAGMSTIDCSGGSRALWPALGKATVELAMEGGERVEVDTGADGWMEGGKGPSDAKPKPNEMGRPLLAKVLKCKLCAVDIKPTGKGVGGEDNFGAGEIISNVTTMAGVPWQPALMIAVILTKCFPSLIMWRMNKKSYEEAQADFPIYTDPDGAVELGDGGD